MIDNNPILDFLINLPGKTSHQHNQFEDFFCKFLYTLPVILCISDINDGKIIYVNQLFADTLEYALDEVIGKTSQELKLFIDHKDRIRISKLVLKNGVTRNNEVKLLTKTGRTLTALVSGDVIRHNENKYFISFIVDITDKKNMETRLASIERLKLMGELAASIGHEIRNPLNTVYGFLQLNKLKGCYTLTQDDYDLMISELQRANAIIDEFLYLSKEKTLNMVKHNLTRILYRIAPLIKTEASRNRKFVKIELSNVPDLMLDEGEIRQLVFNMVRNGLEAMEEGKCLTVKTFLKDGKVVLMVQDEGKGIDNDVLDKVGSPFFTTKENGTGLGLSNCYNIAHRHNANIQIDTGPDGTTFSVVFHLPKSNELYEED